MNELVQRVKSKFVNNAVLNSEDKLILHNLISNTSILTTWEENFWLAKYVDEYENNDARFDRYIAVLFEEALSKGLTYRLNEQYFFEASLVIAKHHFKYQKYQLAENSLLLLRELNRDKKSLPNWVFQYSAITFYKLNFGYIITHEKEFFDAIDDIDDTDSSDRTQKIFLLKDFLNSIGDYRNTHPSDAEKTNVFERAFRKHIGKYHKELAQQDFEYIDIRDSIEETAQSTTSHALTQEHDNEVIALRNLVDTMQFKNNDLSEKLESSQAQILNLNTLHESVKVSFQSQLTSYLRELEEVHNTAISTSDEINDLKSKLMNEIKINAEMKGQIVELRGVSEGHNTSIEQLNKIIEDRDFTIEQLRDENATLRVFRDRQKPEILQSEDIKGSIDYCVRKRDFRILVLGGSEINADNIYRIAKRFGISRNQLDLKIDYDKITNFNIESIRYQSVYSAVLIGPVPHSVKNKGESTSIVTKMSTEEGYPLNKAMYSESGELKITKASFEKALSRILDQLKSVGIA